MTTRCRSRPLFTKRQFRGWAPGRTTVKRGFTRSQQRPCPGGVSGDSASQARGLDLGLSLGLSLPICLLGCRLTVQVLGQTPPLWQNQCGRKENGTRKEGPPFSHFCSQGAFLWGRDMSFPGCTQGTCISNAKSPQTGRLRYHHACDEAETIIFPELLLWLRSDEPV